VRLPAGPGKRSSRPHIPQGIERVVSKAGLQRPGNGTNRRYSSSHKASRGHLKLSSSVRRLACQNSEFCSKQARK
jgi:hypothetical protein